MEKPLNDILVEMKSSFDSFITTAEQLIAEQKTKPEFKKGDFITISIGSEKCGLILGEKVNYDLFSFVARIFLDRRILFLNEDARVMVETASYATKAERIIMLDILYAEGKRWDAEKKEVVDYIWQPKRGEKFWYVHGKMAYPSSRECINVQETLIELGNYYKTRELAEDAAQAEIEFRKTLKHY